MPGPIDPASILAESFRLLNAEDAASTVTAETPTSCLHDLLLAPPTAGAATAVLTLTGADELSCDIVTSLLQSRWASVRAAAADTIRTRKWLTRAEIDERLRRELRANLTQLLATDSSWMSRRAAVETLFASSSDHEWMALAATDPHWRVRNALLNILLAPDADPDWSSGFPDDPRARGLRAYLDFVAGREPTDRSDVAAAETGNDWLAELRSLWPELADSDPHVVAREVAGMVPEAQQAFSLKLVPWLRNPTSAVRKAVTKVLLRYGDADDFTLALRTLDDPREAGADDVSELMTTLGVARRIATAARIVAMEAPSVAQMEWAIRQATQIGLHEHRPWLNGLASQAPSLPERAVVALLEAAAIPGLVGEGSDTLVQWGLESTSQLVQLAALGAVWLLPPDLPDAVVPLVSSPWAAVRARAVAVCHRSTVIDWESLAADPRALVRTQVARILSEASDIPVDSSVLAALQDDEHPFVRRAAMTSESAGRLIERPTEETSWHVVARAARMTKCPEWRIAPPGDTRKTSGRVSADPEDAPAFAHPTPRPQASLPRVRLETAPRPGDEAEAAGVDVARIGLSGHYHLPETGFAEARERGVNLLFWEPNYATMTRFMRSLTAAQRSEMHIIAGSFAATPAGLRRDVQRALRSLRVERLALFLIFWVRSWHRVGDGMTRALEQMRSAGMIGMSGLSTHDRDFAVDALTLGWSPIMVRHSLAHRGAEERVLPRAVKQGTSVITFNNTCYGRLLTPIDDSVTPTPAECYQYSLSQPGVTACLTAPSTREQLHQNLEALERPPIAPERLSQLLAHGDRVLERDRCFARTVRWV